MRVSNWTRFRYFHYGQEWQAIMSGYIRMLGCRREANMKIHATAYLIGGVLLISLALAAPLWAQTSLHDPNLPSVKPEALQQLSDNRIRQQIMRDSQAHYPGRCVCRYQTLDSNRHSCKGRHEVIKSRTRPMCYPRQVTSAMVSDWRRRHP
jgi:hypothetical protein